MGEYRILSTEIFGPRYRFKLIEYQDRFGEHGYMVEDAEQPDDWGLPDIIAYGDDAEELKQRVLGRYPEPIEDWRDWGDWDDRVEASRRRASVASIILEQLGGGQFIAMTGAKDLVDGGDYLGFKLPSHFARNGINYVRITLTPDDLYNIEFGKIRGFDYIVVEEYNGVYFDQLQEIFTQITGLDTHL